MVAEHDKVVKVEYKPSTCFTCQNSIVIYTETGVFVYSPVSRSIRVNYGHVKVYKFEEDSLGHYYYYFR